jgi:hypothetical protein
MHPARLVAILTLMLWSNVTKAEVPPDIQHYADIMVRLCVGGGHTEASSGSGDAGANLSLRSLDITGSLKGQFTVSKSNAEGLVNGIDNALTQVAANQADQVRTCLAPLRARIIEVWFPAPAPAAPKPIVEKTFRYDTPGRCYIDPDIRFCGFVGGVGTVTLRGTADSHNFLLTIKGELQPQVSMNGTELVIATPVTSATNDQTAIVHRIHNGPGSYQIDETVDFNNSRFPLSDITDVHLKAVSHFP